jgi:hypothetical protein
MHTETEEQRLARLDRAAARQCRTRSRLRSSKSFRANESAAEERERLQAVADRMLADARRAPRPKEPK